jgi:hypothetical protein
MMIVLCLLTDWGAFVLPQEQDLRAALHSLLHFLTLLLSKNQQLFNDLLSADNNTIVGNASFHPPGKEKFEAALHSLWPDWIPC